jgi:hypothetical protein
MWTRITTALQRREADLGYQHYDAEDSFLCISNYANRKMRATSAASVDYTHVHGSNGATIITTMIAKTKRRERSSHFPFVRRVLEPWRPRVQPK